jgi:hypothetical protein
VQSLQEGNYIARTDHQLYFYLITSREKQTNLSPSDAYPIHGSRTFHGAATGPAGLAASIMGEAEEWCLAALRGTGICCRCWLCCSLRTLLLSVASLVLCNHNRVLPWGCGALVISGLPGLVFVLSFELSA